MKYALVDGRRQEAEPNLNGTCPAYGCPMVPKCGERRAWHWAHKGRRVCDPWLEKETDWHRNWKDQFPNDWQEIVHRADDGERHIADVKTPDGWVIEFQHSYIKPEERRSRDAFYDKLIWVVDGLRRPTDLVQFEKAWRRSRPVSLSSMRILSADDARLLREWADSPASVFFDFGEDQALAWLLHKKPGGPVYVAPFPRAEFIQIHRQTGTRMARDFDSFVEELSELVDNYESHLRTRAPNRFPPHPARRRRL